MSAIPSTKPQRKRPSEISEARFRVSATDPLSIKQRDGFEAFCAANKRVHQSFETTIIVSLEIPFPHPDLTALAQKHAHNTLPGPTAYARSLRELDIPMTPAAEMIYLATRLHHIDGKAMDLSKEMELRARMVEILAESDWLCDPHAYLDFLSDDGPTDYLHLFQCGLIGPELAAIADRPRVRETLSTMSVPSVFESEELSDEQAHVAVDLCDMPATMSFLAFADTTLYESARTSAYASDSSGVDVMELFLKRVEQGVIDGSISAEMAQPYASPEVVSCHLEVFLVDDQRSLPLLEANMAKLATLRGSAPADTDVYGVPAEMFWPCLLHAVQFNTMPNASVNFGRPVDQVATGTWIDLMTIAHATGLRADTLLTVEGEKESMPFGEALRKHAGRSASHVFESMETRDAMETRIVSTPKTGQAGGERVPGRRRGLGI